MTHSRRPNQSEPPRFSRGGERSAGKLAAFREVRRSADATRAVWERNIPDSAELRDALAALERATLAARFAIARNGQPYFDPPGYARRSRVTGR